MLNFSLLLMRVIVGAIMYAHGAQKLFGLYGGFGLAPLVEKMGPIGYLVAVGECLGGIGIALGFLTRFSAASNLVIMLGAIGMVHGKNGFFLISPQGQIVGGFEYNLALIGLLAPIMLLGPGSYAVGKFLPLPKNKFFE
jgi:putative oxidoreductase